jgi:hypothetical protein
MDPDPGSQTYADLDTDPGQTVKSQKVQFLKNILKVRSKSILSKVQKCFLKCKKQGLLFNFGQFSCS